MAYEEIRIREEAGRCLLCHNAACSEACQAEIDVAGILRSLRFENMQGARNKLVNPDACSICIGDCMCKCNRGKIDRPVDINSIFKDLTMLHPGRMEKGVDLSIDFCGITCENPFFLSSSVVGSNYEMVAKAFDMGWAGVAFKTIGLFVPEEVSPRFAALKKETNPFVGFKNLEQISDHSLEENLSFLKQLKKDYPSKVIIASIMGQNEEEWTTLAKVVEEAGADIIECNFSCPQMVGEGLGSDVGTDPELVLRFTKAVRAGTKLPILAKMTPNITNMEIPARAAVEAGADGIAAINTIKCIMNVNLESFVSEPRVNGKTSVSGYSGKAVKPIALRFIQDMKKDPVLKNIPISGMGGIENWKDGAEFIALGCENLQITTAVMQYGYRIIEDLLDGLRTYLHHQHMTGLKDLVGRALEGIVPADELERETIEYPKFNRSNCIACGRCYVSCFDGGHQAIVFEKGQGPKLSAKNCVGCQLCRLVCPVNAISAGNRVLKKKYGSDDRCISVV